MESKSRRKLDSNFLSYIRLDSKTILINVGYMPIYYVYLCITNAIPDVSNHLSSFSPGSRSQFNFIPVLRQPWKVEIVLVVLPKEKEVTPEHPSHPLEQYYWPLTITQKIISSSIKGKKTTIKLKVDDLPDVVLVDILCRLPRHASVCKYKYVCKRWSNLMSDPSFIGRFLLGHPRRRMKQLPILINRNGESFPYTLKSSSKLVTRVFEKIMTSLSLKKELVVVGACN